MEDEDDYDKFSVDDEEDPDYEDDIDDNDSENNNILGEQKQSQLVDYNETYTHYKVIICRFRLVIYSAIN